MTEKHSNLINHVIALGDDSMILGQRLSEWCYHAPFLEEDLALANVALDFIGRAQMFYEYASQLEQGKRSADQIAFLRDTRDYRNLLIMELPIGDFAFTMARQFMVDAYNNLYLQQLAKSSDKTLAAIAAKAIKETDYHLRRSQEWVLRLGDGTDESHRRIQKAFDELWGYSAELFAMSEYESALLSKQISVDRSALSAEWKTLVADTLNQATVKIPSGEWQVTGGREGIHTEHHGHMLAEMQYLQRTYPGVEW